MYDDYYHIYDEEITRISWFCQDAERNFHGFAGARNLSIDFKYDVLYKRLEICIRSWRQML